RTKGTSETKKQCFARAHGAQRWIESITSSLLLILEQRDMRLPAPELGRGAGFPPWAIVWHHSTAQCHRGDGGAHGQLHWLVFGGTTHFGQGARSAGGHLVLSNSRQTGRRSASRMMGRCSTVRPTPTGQSTT